MLWGNRTWVELRKDLAVSAQAAILPVGAAGPEGIRERIDPGDPNEDNLYTISDQDRRNRNIQFLPQTLPEAVSAFAADPLIETTLGNELRDEFVKYKTMEWEGYHLTVSRWEVERHSHLP